ncbi:hypothetical protein N7451_009306 [Penicillium sp. IBT 35674x]|nr:hypothetical protein N7451_009306 [Penicillium sp. IBT 35674x]
MVKGKHSMDRILVICWSFSIDFTISKAVHAASATYACEASSAIKTVASLNLDSHVLKENHNILEAQR